jgi:hypothetical protein
MTNKQEKTPGQQRKSPIPQHIAPLSTIPNSMVNREDKLEN